MKYSSLLIATLLVASPVMAQDTLLNVPKPDVEKELAQFEVADGFELNLFASDPDVANPIHMNWDAEGRLWVVGSAVYPHIEPGQAAADTVTILEDTDGDGVADKSTIFAEGLFIPTGIVPGDGGAYIANSTELLHMKDTDGDGRADETRVVLSGFGTEDTHHILHSLRWGYDGLLYMNQSIYIHSHVETPHGVKRLNAGGIWQFRPETMELEVFARGFVNPWGHHFDEWGQHFATDGAYHEGINYVFPGAAYLTAYQMPRVLKGLNEGQPKHCGLEVLSGRHLPEDWRGTMVTHDFRGHRVARFRVTDENGMYTSVELPEVMKTDHVSFRPVDVKMGPDGAIYIADWYNPIIQHGEVDFRDPRRDHEHGRIWRVSAKGRDLLEHPNFDAMDANELADMLEVPERWNRIHAKREMKTRDSARVMAALGEKWASIKGDSDADNNLRLEILWTHQTLDLPSESLLTTLLKSEDYRVRAAAVRVLSEWYGRIGDEERYLDTLWRLVRDEHPRVRLEAVRALTRVESPKAATIALDVLDMPMDRFLDYGLWTAMRDLKDAWLDSGEMHLHVTDRQALYALRAVGSPESVPAVLEMYQSGRLRTDNGFGALEIVADHGSPQQLGVIAERTLERPRADHINRLVDATKRRSVKPRADFSSLVALLDNDLEEDVRMALIRAAGAWGVDEAREEIESLAGDAYVSGALQRTAIFALADLGGDASKQALAKLASVENPDQVRAHATRALLTIDTQAGVANAVALLKDGADPDPPGLYRTVIQADGGADAMTAVLADVELPREIAKLGERTISSSGQNVPELLEAIRTAGGMGETITELSPERMAELVEKVRTQGDPARGEAHYRALDCAQCHAIAGAGSNLGPDMTSIGGSAQPDYLIEALLFPSKAIKEGFHSLVVDTNDFETFSGIKVGETGTELILRSATDPEIRIAKDNIESAKDGGSLMPTGLTDTLLESEFVDLVAFMTALGREPEFSAGTGRHVRTWRTLADTPAATDYLYEASPEAVLNPHETLIWEPAYSRVTGKLPLSHVSNIGHRYWTTSYAFLQFSIESDTAGVAALKILPEQGARLWANGSEIPVAAKTLLDLDAGTTVCTVIIDRAAATTAIDIQLIDDPEATVTARFTGGR